MRPRTQQPPRLSVRPLIGRLRCRTCIMHKPAIAHRKDPLCMHATCIRGKRAISGPDSAHVAASHRRVREAVPSAEHWTGDASMSLQPPTPSLFKTSQRSCHTRED